MTHKVAAFLKLVLLNNSNQLLIDKKDYKKKLHDQEKEESEAYNVTSSDPLVKISPAPAEA